MSDSFLDIPLRNRGGSTRRSGRPTFNPDTGRNADDPLPIGVPEGYTAPVPTDLRGMSTRAAEGWSDAGRGHGTIHPRSPRYYEGDEYRVRPMSPAAIAAIQDQMARAGLLTTDFMMGVWDPATAEAYKVLLGQANAQGITVEQAMTLMGSGEQMQWDPATGTYQSVGGSAGPAPVPELVTRVTDPEVLKSVFRRAAIEMIGIGWSEEQLERAAAAYNNVERTRQQEQYDAQLAAGQLGSMTEGGVPTASEVVDIPSPEGWVDSYIREQDPAGVAENQALDMVDVFMQTAGSTAWGVGRQI